MKRIAVYMFIDALGWELVNRYNFLEKELLHRRKVEMQFGYSSTAMPTILSGENPDKHGHFSFFYYDEKNSPFKKFKSLKYLILEKFLYCKASLTFGEDIDRLLLSISFACFTIGATDATATTANIEKRSNFLFFSEINCSFS